MQHWARALSFTVLELGLGSTLHLELEGARERGSESVYLQKEPTVLGVNRRAGNGQ